MSYLPSLWAAVRLAYGARLGGGRDGQAGQDNGDRSAGSINRGQTRLLLCRILANDLCEFVAIGHVEFDARAVNVAFDGTY
jgi:hypothetical protein